MFVDGEGPWFQRQERQAVRRAQEEGHEQGARRCHLELARSIETWRQVIGRRIFQFFGRNERGSKEVLWRSQEIDSQEEVHEFEEVHVVTQVGVEPQEDHLRSEEDDVVTQEHGHEEEVDRSQEDDLFSQEVHRSEVDVLS